MMTFLLLLAFERVIENSVVLFMEASNLEMRIFLLRLLRFPLINNYGRAHVQYTRIVPAVVAEGLTLGQYWTKNVRQIHRNFINKINLLETIAHGATVIVVYSI
jgi:hypothetical protein